MSQKEESLSRLDDSDLLELAKSVSKDQIDSRISKNHLIKIVKASLSIEEIKQKVNETGNPAKISAPRSKAFTLGGTGQVFFAIYGIAYLIVMSAPPTHYPMPIAIPVAMIQEGAVFGLAEAGLLMVFAVLNMISMTALRQEFSGNKTGLISGSIALASSTLAMFYSIATILGLTYAVIVPTPGIEQANYNLLGTFLQVFNLVLMMLTLASIGVFFLVHRQQLPGGISLAAGFVYVFASISSLSYLVYGYYYAYFNPLLGIVAGVPGGQRATWRTRLHTESMDVSNWVLPHCSLMRVSTDYRMGASGQACKTFTLSFSSTILPIISDVPSASAI